MFTHPKSLISFKKSIRSLWTWLLIHAMIFHHCLSTWLICIYGHTREHKVIFNSTDQTVVFSCNKFEFAEFLKMLHHNFVEESSVCNLSLHLLDQWGCILLGICNLVFHPLLALAVAVEPTSSTAYVFRNFAYIWRHKEPNGPCPGLWSASAAFWVDIMYKNSILFHTALW